MVECECSCEDIRKIVKEIVTETFQQRIAEAKTRKKRAPSKYNIFVGECMKKPGENMKTCAAKYKQQKGKEPKKKEEGPVVLGKHGEYGVVMGHTVE